VAAAAIPSAILLAGAGVCLWAEDPDPDLSLKDTVKAGPFHLAPFLAVKDFGYDSNVRLDADNKVGDYAITVGPGARAVLPLGRKAAVAFWDEIDYVAFARESDLNHVNNTLKAKVHGYMQDFILYADGQQDSFRERPNTEIDFRIRNTTTQGRLGISYRPPSRTGADVYVHRLVYGYNPGKADVPAGTDPNDAENILQQGEIVSDTLERTETNLGLQGRLKVRPRTTFLLDLIGGRINFDSTLPQRDSTTATAMAGFEFDPASSVRGTAKVGYKHLAPDEEAVDGFSGLIADTGVSVRLAGRGELRGVFQRDTGFSTLGDNLYYIQTHYGLNYEHYLTTRLSAEVGHHLYEVDYPIPITVDYETDPGTGMQTPVQEHRRDDITRDMATIRFRLGPTLKIGLAVELWNRDSTFDSEDTDRTTVTTLLEYTP
jgi:hypothetical protein